MTAEDPVEFNLPGINQVQMKEQIGLNFAAALRSFLRQDPNIVLVGEIRDF
jgi:type IV pilus assembly protein PilB